MKTFTAVLWMVGWLFTWGYQSRLLDRVDRSMEAEQIVLAFFTWPNYWGWYLASL